MNEEASSDPQENIDSQPANTQEIPVTQTLPQSFVSSYNEPAQNRKKGIASFWGRIRLDKLFAASRTYLAEYALLLIITAGLVWLVNSLFGGLVDYIGKDNPTTPWYGGSFAYTASLGMLAGAAVLVPVLVLFTRRTRTSEADDPSIKNIGWRKAFLGVFLLNVALAAICYGVAFTYQLFSWLASFGLGASGDSVVWKSLLKAFFAIVLFVFTSWLYARDYRATDETYSRWSRIHRYSLVILAIILATIFTFTVLREQRSQFIDGIITNDLRTLQSKVNAYESEKNRLPKNIDDLDLDKQLKAHAKSFAYEYSKSSKGYTLCAVFKTDTKNQKTSYYDNPLERLSSGSSISDDYYRGNQDDDPAVHGRGRQCFDYTAYSSSRSDTYYDNRDYQDRGNYQGDYLEN